VTSYKRSISEIIVTMLRRKRQPAEDRAHLIRQDDLPEGNASVLGMPTLFLSGLGRTLLSWVSSVMKNCVLPSSRHDRASYQPSAGSPFCPVKPKPKVSEPLQQAGREY
jgi:hypothetical protein